MNDNTNNQKEPKKYRYKQFYPCNMETCIFNMQEIGNAIGKIRSDLISLPEDDQNSEERIRWECNAKKALAIKESQYAILEKIYGYLLAKECALDAGYRSRDFLFLFHEKVIEMFNPEDYADICEGIIEGDPDLKEQRNQLLKATMDFEAEQTG